MRAVSGLEVASVVGSVLIATWVIIPLLPDWRWLIAVPGALALGLIINSHRVRRESLGEIGFSLDHFGRAIKLVSAPTLIGCAVFAAIGLGTGSFHGDSNFMMKVAFLPFWGLFQQFILQGFIYRRMRVLLFDQEAGRARAYPAIIASSAIFAFVHLPNPALTIMTFAGGLIWSWVYERAPNLYALALSHATLSLMLMTTMPPWMLESMSVGYKHFLYQKF